MPAAIGRRLRAASGSSREQVSNERLAAALALGTAGEPPPPRLLERSHLPLPQPPRRSVPHWSRSTC